jgi:hypothetical protein
MNTQTKQIDWVKVFSIVTAIVFAFLWLKGCTSSNPEPQIAKVEVTVPEVQGKFAAQKPINTPIVKWSNSTTLKSKSNLPKNENTYFDKYKKTIVQNEPIVVNSEIKSDSIVKKPCEQQLNNFSTKFEDENLELNLEGVVQGEVKEITPSYKIKERKIETAVKEKQVAFRMLGGVEVGNTLVLDKFAVKANLMFQNKKGNIFSASMDTNKAIWVGYSASIFSIKR